jgi:hypothetical protein
MKRTDVFLPHTANTLELGGSSQEIDILDLLI